MESFLKGQYTNNKGYCKRQACSNFGTIAGEAVKHLPTMPRVI